MGLLQRAQMSEGPSDCIAIPLHVSHAVVYLSVISSEDGSDIASHAGLLCYTDDQDLEDEELLGWVNLIWAPSRGEGEPPAEEFSGAKIR